ncbi:MAG: DUF3240 family protein [Deltaproteobacteria bacterium]|nr:DUF3240 family protein [Deltaproteobacteria bacterium]
MEDCLLVLFAAPELEEPLIDWLLEREDVPGFGTQRIAGHGTSPASLRLAEQVAGRRPRLRVEIALSRENAPALLEALRREFGGSGLHYWVLPFLDAGRF